MTIHPVKVTWFSCEERRPPERVVLMVTGPAMTRRVERYLTLAYIDEEYRPPLGKERFRWISIYNDDITDGNSPPTHWAYPIELPDI